MTYEGLLWDSVPITFTELPKVNKPFVYRSRRAKVEQSTEVLLIVRKLSYSRYSFETEEVHYELQVTVAPN